MLAENNIFNQKCCFKKNKYFNQICLHEIVTLPSGHPDIEQIVSAVVDPEIISIKAVNTMKGLSYEGQYLSGKKLVVEIRFKQKILYVANTNTQSVHVLENEFYQSAYIVIPCLFEGTDPQLLIKYNILKCNIHLEDVFVKCIDKRTIFKNICIYLSIHFSPTYEICYLSYHNCNVSDINIMHNNGNHSYQIANTSYKNLKTPIWSPLGREIAFISNYQDHNILNIYSLSTLSTRQLLSTSKFDKIGSYCWAHTSSDIIFSGYINGCRDIYSVNIQDSHICSLTNGNGIYQSFKPKCSPNGELIGLLRKFSGLTDLWVMTDKGMEYKKLTFCGNVKDFDWCMDSKNIFYISCDAGNKYSIHNINLDCLQDDVISIPKSNCKKSKIKVSPDGNYFAFIGSNLDIDNIFIHCINENNTFNITNNHNNVIISDFVWSADSDKIYYAENNFISFNIFSVSIDCYEKHQITNTTASKIELSYRPKII